MKKALALFFAFLFIAGIRIVIGRAPQPKADVPAPPTFSMADANDDGTPDFLNLGAEDAAAFRQWFTFLAESQFYRKTSDLPKEIDDCAALLRFAYREALREHNAQWANDLKLESLRALPEIRKYHYPHTPLGASLFRVGDDGTFAQFADAKTLQRLNTHFVSRDVRAALPGDLLFYRQLDQSMPFHAMIVLGPSHFEPDRETRVVYHTGPIGAHPGEIRRPTLDALLHHPEPKWRPFAANGNFLGVFRWNIVR